MKKRIFFFIELFILSIVLGLMISIILKKDTYQLTVFKKSYCFVSTFEEEQLIDVIVYLSCKDPGITNIKQINNAYIRDTESNNIMKLEVKEIINTNTKKKIFDCDYYVYSYTFKIPFETNTEFEMKIPNAIITLESNQQNIDINIGSFYYYKIPYYGDFFENISINKVKPIVNNYNENKTLSGIVIGLKNNTDYEVKIKRIRILENNIYVSANDVINLTNDFECGDDISDLLGYEYDQYDDSELYNDQVDLTLKKDETNEYLLPLKYTDKYPVNNCGFIVEYELGEEEFKLYFDNFIYFASSSLYVLNETMDICTYENS